MDSWFGESNHYWKGYISGLKEASLLSEDLIREINRKHIFFLFQASRPSSLSLLGQNWVTSTIWDWKGTLAMSGKITETYFLHAGIVLKENPDELSWIGDDNTGLISVKNVYNTLSNKFWPGKAEGWRIQLWKWSCPLKIKLFLWLLLENKILTWENLQRRGWYGPGICCLCGTNEESSQHVFVSCPSLFLFGKKLNEV
jgi:hypothetical protein